MSDVSLVRGCLTPCTQISLKLDFGQDLNQYVRCPLVGLTAWSGTEIIPYIKYRRISAGRVARTMAPQVHILVLEAANVLPYMARWQMRLN